MKKQTQNKGKRPFALSTALFAVLVLIGLGVLFYPTLSDLYTRWQIRQELRRYNQVLAAGQADYSAFWQAAEAYNQTLPEKADRLLPTEEECEQTYALLNPNGSNVLGYIEIPAIQVALPIYRGTEEKQLQSGAGWWIGSSLPTGGAGTHCIITAHTGLAKAKFFTDLDQLEQGDRFTLTVLDRVMTYEVDQILVTTPEEIEPLQIIPGEDYVTLYTCTPYGINTHRLLVRGRRVEPEAEAVPADAPAQEADAGLPWLVWPALALLVVLTTGTSLWLAAYAHIRRKTRKTDREGGASI